MNINRFNNWRKEVFSWASEARLAFLCCSVLVMTFFFSFYMYPSENSIRRSGYVLQIFGMIFAIHGLLKIRAHFGQPTLTKLFKAWMVRFPTWKKDTVIGVGAGSLVMIGEKARAEVWNPDNPETPLEKRIDGIVKNIERMREAQRRHSEQIDELQDDYIINQKKQAQELKNIKDQVMSNLESLQTDDIVLSLIGLVWLTFGISMSTIPQELSKIVSWLLTK